MKTLALDFEQMRGVVSRFERVPQPGQAHQPDRVLHVCLALDTERCPTGIGNPAVLFGEMALKEQVTNGARKWNVDVSPRMHVADLCFAEAVFDGGEPVGMNRDP